MLIAIMPNLHDGSLSEATFQEAIYRDCPSTDLLLARDLSLILLSIREIANVDFTLPVLTRTMVRTCGFSDTTSRHVSIDAGFLNGDRWYCDHHLPCLSDLVHNDFCYQRAKHFVDYRVGVLLDDLYRFYSRRCLAC